MGDFFVLASPAKNDQVKFVSGDAEIRALADVVKSSNLDIAFPEPSAVRALRRGTVSCGTIPPASPSKSKPAKKGNGKGGEDTANKTMADSSKALTKPELIPGPCSVMLLPSDEVRSVD
jgi:hypothetical protein